MLNLITKILSLVERLLDWFVGSKKARERNEVRRVVAEHDREGMNALLQKRRDER